MIRLFQLLIFGYSCNHKWEWVREIGNQWECRVLLQCEHCGKVKSKKTL